MLAAAANEQQHDKTLSSSSPRLARRNASLILEHPWRLGDLGGSGTVSEGSRGADGSGASSSGGGRSSKCIGGDTGDLEEMDVWQELRLRRLAAAKVQVEEKAFVWSVLGGCLDCQAQRRRLRRI